VVDGVNDAAVVDEDGSERSKARTPPLKKVALARTLIALAGSIESDVLELAVSRAGLAWTARALRAAGVPVHPVLALTARTYSARRGRSRGSFASVRTRW
jgi:hypothetical protein